MTEEVKGTISVCAHRVQYSYEIESIDITDELKEVLEAEAESRAKAMIIEGYVQGELNCVWEGETEIGGWWKIL